MSTAVAATPGRDRSATGPLLVAGIVLATLTEAIASTVLSLGRNDMIGDIHATPDEFAWLDIGYTALEADRVHGRALADDPYRSAPPDHRRDAGHGHGMRHCRHHSPLGPAGRAPRHPRLLRRHLACRRPGHHLSRLSAIPPTDPSGPVCDGVGRRSRDHRPGSAGMAGRQPVLDMDFLQRCSGCPRRCWTSVDRGRPETRCDLAPSVRLDRLLADLRHILLLHLCSQPGQPMATGSRSLASCG